MYNRIVRLGFSSTLRNVTIFNNELQVSIFKSPAEQMDECDYKGLLHQEMKKSPKCHVNKKFKKQHKQIFLVLF
jgi:hypothetical protein